MKNRVLFRILPVSLAILGVVACDVPSALTSEEAAPSAPRSEVKSAEHDMLKAVRQATARYNSMVQAARAGYAGDDQCVEHPDLGGMGYHWVNFGFVDDQFDPLRPEALLYAQVSGGNVRLVGVEYVVVDVEQDAPVFGDQAFDVGGAPLPFAHWTLHVWLYEDNPSGIFADHLY